MSSSAATPSDVEYDTVPVREGGTRNADDDDDDDPTDELDGDHDKYHGRSPRPSQDYHHHHLPSLKEGIQFCFSVFVLVSITWILLRVFAPGVHKTDTDTDESIPPPPTTVELVTPLPPPPPPVVVTHHNNNKAGTSASGGIRKGWRVVATAFVGRRDRSWLLVEYLQELVRRGLVSEVHFWDFTRNAEDKEWLSRLHAPLLVTPNQQYYTGQVRVDQHPKCQLEPHRSFLPLRYRVSARTDVHLKIHMRSGKEYEFILGAIENQVSFFRKMGAPDSEWQTNMWMYIRTPEPAFMNVQFAFNGTHGHVEMYTDDEDWFSFALSMPHDIIRDANQWLIAFPDINAPDGKEELEFVEFSTGFHSSGTWQMQSLCDEPLTPADNPFRMAYPKPSDYQWWTEYYRHYNAHRNTLYDKTVLLKMDDDTIWIDVNRFKEFIDYRITHPDPFLIFPNIINNGVAAYFQQSKQGVIPVQEVGEMELPPGGFQGSLWADKSKSYRLHRYFLSKPERFTASSDPEELCYDIEPSLRFSINFFAIIPQHVHFYSWILYHSDDEWELTVGITQRFGMHKCLYPHMTTAHMAFYVQGDDQQDRKILYGYALQLNRTLPNERIHTLVADQIRNLNLIDPDA
jgi:hypothetical protein